MLKNSMWVIFAAVVMSASGCGATKNEEVESQPMVEEAVLAMDEAEAEAPAPKAQSAPAQSGEFRLFSIYADSSSPDNHYVPSGWMGDYGDIKFNDKYMQNPHSGTTSIQIVYNGRATQGARWAGVYWQNPPNNWGTRPGGFDLTGAKKLTFWVRGEKGGERIEEFKIGGISGEYADSDVAGIGPVVLTTDWQELTIDLEGKDLSSISGGFCWSTNLDVNPDGCTFYLDDIKYE